MPPEAPLRAVGSATTVSAPARSGQPAEAPGRTVTSDVEPATLPTVSGAGAVASVVASAP